MTDQPNIDPGGHTVIDNIYSELQRVASRRGTATALRFYGETWTFDELVAETDRWAKALVHAGVREGDRVVVVMAASPEFVLSFFAVARIGAIFVPLSSDAVEREVDIVVERAAPSLAVLTSDGCGPAHGLIAARAMPCVVVERSRLNPNGEAVAVDDVDTATAFLDRGTGTEIPPVASGSNLVVLWFTSGTTGQPKAAAWNHDDFVANGRDKWDHLLRCAPDEVALSAVPIAHNGFASNTIGPILRGHTVELLRGPTPSEIAAHLIEGDITFYVTAPSIMRLVLNAARERGEVQTSLRHVIIGAAPVSAEMFDEIRSVAEGVRIYYGYGAAEGIISALDITEHSDKLASVGRPYPGVELQLRLLEGGEAPTGEIGNVHIRGRGIIDSYWPDETTNFDEDGWLALNDLARLDEEGCVWIVGRKNDAINTGGFKVLGTEVEAVLATHPRVAEIAVAGRPDEILGERVVAFVIPGEGATDHLEAELREFAQQQLTKYKRPREYRFVDQFPKTPLGKVQKNRL